jgi:16S rRNA (adenine1518-N6/adenine1519-N6)-dimethyltransferase
MRQIPSLPKKSLGQHWLDDADVLAAMCQAADVSTADTVLEIGPGLGSLTKVLVTKAKQIMAVEFDEELADDLPRQIPVDNLQVITRDILKFDLTTLPAGYKVVANIPYYLTSNLIRILSESPNPPSIAALLVQKEVAQRVAAEPSDMSILAVTAQFYWQVNLGQIVPAELFTPPPKVDSQILILKRRAEPLFDVDAKKFFRLVKAGFAQKRKTLQNNLSSGLGINKSEARQILESAGIEPTTRAQSLSLDDWHKLYGAHFLLVS